MRFEEPRGCQIVVVFIFEPAEVAMLQASRASSRRGFPQFSGAGTQRILALPLLKNSRLIIINTNIK